MSGRSSRSNRGSTDPLGDLLENLKQNPIPGLFSSSSTENSVVLYDWWLATSCVEGQSKRLAIAGYIAKKKCEAPFMSAPIVKRHDTFTLEAADGVTVKVEGMINQTNTQYNGFSHEVCERFNIGFPFFWKQYIDSCADLTPTPGANTSQILEQLVPGVRNILNPNLAAADPIEIDDDTLGYSPGSSTPKEFEPAHEGNPVSSDNNLKAETVVNLVKKDTTNLEKEDTTSNKRSDAPRRSGRTKQHEDRPISTDGKEAEEFATPQKDDTLSDKKLPSAGRRKNAAAQSKVPDMSPTSVKGSSRKVRVLQSRDKTSDRGCRQANMEVHGATISPPLSESNIRRSRSGRVIIPTIDKGSQTVVYDQNGNFAGVSAVSTGNTSKPNIKKRRF